MQSTSQKGPSSTSSTDEYQTVLLPGNQTNTSTSEVPTTSDHDGRGSGKPWQPKFNRQQSWSEQDLKHELLRGWLSVERGKEAGFTETSRDA